MHSKYCKQYEINQQYKIISCFCINCFNIQYKLYCYLKWQPYNCQTIYNSTTKVLQDFWILTQKVEKDIAKMSANSSGLWYFCYFFLLIILTPMSIIWKDYWPSPWLHEKENPMCLLCLNITYLPFTPKQDISVKNWIIKYGH